MAKISTTNRSEYYKISSFIFLYFFTWSASIGLLAIWLGQKANLSGTVIGTVFAVNGIFSVILKPIYGYILDKIGMSKYLLYFVVAMSALMAPFFIYVYQPLLMSNTMLGIIVGAIYLSFAWYAGVAACESYTDRYSRLNGMEFGQIRMWGSLGWAVASSFSGLLFNLSPAYNFMLGSVASIVMLVVLFSLKVDTRTAHASEVLTKEKIAPADVYALLKSRKFWAFCLYVAGVAWMMFIAEQQFSRYFVTFFDDVHQGNAIFGYLGTVQSGMEFIMYMVIPLFVNYVGAKKGLLIVGLLVGARLIISGVCDSHLLISVLKPLYGLEICLLLVSVFKYIAEHFDKRVNATMYLLGYQAMLYVGNVVVSSPAGLMYDRIGFEQTYIIMGSIALFFTLVSAFTLSACQSKMRPSAPLDVAGNNASR
ncbi:oligosaccharide MFS transporter [Enterobacter kobei]|jgi:OHS family lactose permease-like MFS transporter|uniref:MFS transporter n=4 Tax=Gammaproteobacteria TaxID=1236 RepID=A0AA86ILY8_9ENTR|nr:oligosaccharide MFS transporter [Enterobacter kobei]MDF3007247.1 oligosaccharide/H+ symporter, major facilitator superfamily [Enterobacter kobei]OLR18388.1 MFS transporter [Enterobacter kobei]WNP35303.1 oligosaccharide MFS transporter [Enterobacter kobei]SIR62749.1 MFS transporter, OHS family, lactose permease [Enterobacter kobei]BCU54094.1 MFS transporter [Enterobacter kobei]